MEVREKLVELLRTNACPSPFMCDPACRYYGYGDCFPDRFADHLIAHGVTVQVEAKLYWKLVKSGEWDLTCSACGSHLGCRENTNFCPECGAKFVYPKAVTSQPPKGE